jgi:hypothetical protein
VERSGSVILLAYLVEMEQSGTVLQKGIFPPDSEATDSKKNHRTHWLMFPSVNLPSHISPTSSQALCLHLERRLGLLPNSASCRHLRLEHHLRPELDLTPPLLCLLGSLHRSGEEDWEEVVAARVGAIAPDSCEEVMN